jgi:hypothetical protein
MLMTKDESQLSKLGVRFVEILTAAKGEWLSRSQVGLELGRKLQPYDIALLEQMTKDGLIESREALTGAVKTRWEYRIKK